MKSKGEVKNMKTVKDFLTHFDVFDCSLEEVDTNCLAHATGRRYNDYLFTESTNRRNLHDGEAMEFEAEAYEARYDVKAGLRVLAKRADLVETLETLADGGYSGEGALHLLSLAANHFNAIDVIEAIDAAKKAVASGMVHASENYDAPNWKLPGEEEDDDIYL